MIPDIVGPKSMRLHYMAEVGEIVSVVVATAAGIEPLERQQSDDKDRQAAQGQPVQITAVRLAVAQDGPCQCGPPHRYHADPLAGGQCHQPNAAGSKELI